MTTTSAASTKPVIDEIPLTPSQVEYEHLKKTMTIMVNFYVKGTEGKTAQRDLAQAQLDKVQMDLAMARAQLDALKPFGTVERTAPEIEQLSACPAEKAIEAKAEALSMADSSATEVEAAVPPMGEWDDKPAFKSKYDVDGKEITVLNSHKAPPTEAHALAHPKLKELAEGLYAEIETLEVEEDRFKTLVNEFQLLADWSARIVESVEWLAGNLEKYCNEVMNPSPPFKERPPKELTAKDIEDFRKGLAEVTYNLQESQDFFQASLDGRLERYHKIEHDIIQAQLEALRKFPEDSPRRKALEEEFVKDVDHVTPMLTPDDKTMARRQKMTDMHRDFWGVLKWNRELLQSMDK